MDLECHICGHVTDFRCRECGEPVCEDCCVPSTLQNQIDYTLCTCCHDGNEASAYEYYRREEERQEAKDNKQKLLREAARRRYRLPENVAKRKAKREADKIARTELRKKQMENDAKIISEMFRGMF